MRFLSQLSNDWLDVGELQRLGLSTRVAHARLTSPLFFEVDGHVCYIPAGFITDFASIPKALQSIFSPVDPRYIRAAVIHDYAYRFRGIFPRRGGGFVRLEPLYTRVASDVFFLRSMEAEGAGWVVRHTIYRGVRIGGWVPWNKYRRQEQIMIDQIKRVQRAVGVAVDGIAGPITWGVIALRLDVGIEGCSVSEVVRRVQAHLCVAVDGIAGPQTWGAVEMAVTGIPASLKSISNSARLLAHARRDAGLKEVPGPGSNARIKQAILGAASWLDSDDSKTAWCGCIMGLWCKEIGLPIPAEYYRAANWLNVGEPVELKDAQPGDIVVISRTGGNHVALFVDSSLTLFGGNQANAVNAASFDRSTLRGIRRL